MAEDLDAQVEAFCTRLLDAGPYTFVAADALTRKVRQDGRVVNAAVLVATGVNGDGHREVLGCHVAASETAAARAAVLRQRRRPQASRAGSLNLADEPVEWLILNAEASVQVDLTSVDALDEARGAQAPGHRPLPSPV